MSLFLLYETINLKSSRTTEPNYKILFDPFLKIGRVNYHACLRLQTNVSGSKISTPNPIFDLSAFYDIFIKNFWHRSLLRIIPTSKQFAGTIICFSKLLDKTKSKFGNAIFEHSIKYLYENIALTFRTIRYKSSNHPEILPAPFTMSPMHFPSIKPSLNLILIILYPTIDHTSLYVKNSTKNIQTHAISNQIASNLSQNVLTT